MRRLRHILVDKEYVAIRLTTARTIIAHKCTHAACGADYHFFTDVEDTAAAKIVKALNNE